MPTGLSKQTIDIPLVSGLSPGIAPEVAPAGALYILENADIEKIGIAKRRTGHSFMTNAAYISGTSGVSSTIGTARKVSTRVDELWIVTAENYYLGSGGGGGATGDLLWTYSPELNKWRPRTKVPRPTMERWGGLSNSGLSPEHASVGFARHGTTDLLVVAYVVNTSSGSARGTHVSVFDLTSRAILVEDFLLDEGNATRVHVVSAGRYAVVVWNKGGLNPDIQYSMFDAQIPGDFRAPASLLADPGDGASYAVETDGTSLFCAYYDSPSASVQISSFSLSFSTGATLITTKTLGSAGSQSQWTLAYAGGYMHLGYASANQALYVNVSTDLVTQHGPSTVDTLPLPSIVSVMVCPVDGNNVIVAYDDMVIVGTPPSGTSLPRIHWKQVTTALSAPAVGTNRHSMMNVVPLSQAFTFDGRCYLPVTGCDLENDYRSTSGVGQYSGYGHAIVELSFDTGTGDQYLTALPVALWARDKSRANGAGDLGVGSTGFVIGSGAYGNSSDRYLASLRLLRLVDRFGDGARDPGGGTNAVPALDSAAAYGIDIVRIQLDDPKRWMCAEINKCAVIACALPYAYDGLVAHECGFVFRPEILGIEEIALGGTWLTTTEVILKVTYSWEDIHGNQWFSDSSYPVTYTVVGNNVGLGVMARNPTLSAKPIGGSNFYGRLRITLYRATAHASEDYKKVDEKFINPWELENILLGDANEDVEDNERCYIIGGELDNACMPPCRSVVQHGARLFCISTDDGKVWFTKETRFGRGIEWSAFQTITLPQRGMALCSVESSLLILCEKTIYVLDGQGPNVLGQPPDGFSHLSVLAQDKGCSEINAAWRTPIGCIYRGYQGLWLVNGQLGMSFIGDPVADFTATVSRFVDGVLDTKNARLRLLCLLNSGEYRVINYWYDTMRWSIDTIEENEGTQFSSTIFQGTYYRALTGGVYQADETRYNDGQVLPLYKLKIQTGWFTMGGMPDFKRVWRGLATCGRVRAETAKPLLDIMMTIENEDGICVQRTFKSDLFPESADWTIRAHLTKQKGKFFRMTLEEVENENTRIFSGEGDVYFAADPPGYAISRLGFEFGVKTGAAKLAAGRSK